MSPRRPPQSAEAVERRARTLSRRASGPTFLAVLTAPFAVAYLFTLPVGLFQMFFAARAFRALRRIEPSRAAGPLGIAALVGVALLLESVMTFHPAFLAGDVANLAVLAWAWTSTERARAKHREAWGVREVDVLDASAAIAQRRSAHEHAARARADAEDDLRYLDDLPTSLEE